MGLNRIRSCCQCCHCECGVIVGVESGKVVKLWGDPDHPLNRGLICPKGVAAIELAYHPDRLKYPLKRVGERGESKWQRISWEEALDSIATKFKEIKEKDGPLAISICTGTGPRGYEFFNSQLAYALGCNRMSPGYICYLPSVTAGVVTYGADNTQERGVDYEHAECMLIWGANPLISHPPFGRQIIEGKKRGAKLIVVDPRLTKLASTADIWLQIRPATDDALAMGMLNVIINEGLCDQEFVDKWCIGFEKLRERVQEYSPERVASITWIPENVIREASRLYATTKPAVMHHRVAIEHHTNSMQTLRALNILIAITGNIDVKGGNLCPDYPSGFKGPMFLLTEKVLQPPGRFKGGMLGEERFPLLSGPDSSYFGPISHNPTVIKAMLSGKPYPVKGLLAFSNLVVNSENSKETWQALKKLDFMAAVDFFMTPTAELSDIVLPSATWLEKDEVAYLSYNNYIAVRQKAIEPENECWDDKKIFLELAKRLDLKKWFPWDTIQEFIDYQLKETGITFEELKEKGYLVEPLRYKKYEADGFRTPSGKVELYSSILERYGYDPLPYYQENPESPVSTPELAREYPLILITGSRHIAYFHSEGRQIRKLRRMCPEPLVEMHPDTADQLGIRGGDWVWIETPRGRVRQRAKLTRGIHPEVCSAQHHWWFPEKPGPEHGCWESNINVVTSNDPPYDPIVGSSALRGLLCKVYKDKEIAFKSRLFFSPPEKTLQHYPPPCQVGEAICSTEF